jgi:hypothetical protein
VPSSGGGSSGGAAAPGAARDSKAAFIWHGPLEGDECFRWLARIPEVIPPTAPPEPLLLSEGEGTATSERGDSGAGGGGADTPVNRVAASTALVPSGHGHAATPTAPCW